MILFICANAFGAMYSGVDALAALAIEAADIEGGVISKQTFERYPMTTDRLGRSVLAADG